MRRGSECIAQRGYETMVMDEKVDWRRDRLDLRRLWKSLVIVVVKGAIMSLHISIPERPASLAALNFCSRL